MKNTDSFLKCDICRVYVSLCMGNPLRCIGLGIINGRHYVGKVGTSSFKWWDEVEKDNNDKIEREKGEFFEKHREHLMTHGFN